MPHHYRPLLGDSLRPVLNQRLGPIVVLILITSLLAGSGWARTWTTRDGRTFEGLLSGVVNNAVEIDAKGRIIRIPLQEMSDEDLQYVQQVTSGSYNSNSTSNVGNNENTGLFLDSRTWEDTQGKKIQGRFAGLDGQTIKIAGTNELHQVERNQLSVADQIYIRQLTQALDSVKHGHYWVIQGSNSLRGTFVQAAGAEILLWPDLKSDGVQVPFDQFSSGDQVFICDSIELRKRNSTTIKGTAYRPWTNTAENWMMPARLKDLRAQVVILEQEHDDFFVKLADLSPDDQTYVRQFFPPPPTTQATPDSEARHEVGAWSLGGFNFYALGMSVFALAVLTLLTAISIKYVRDSYQIDD